MGGEREDYVTSKEVGKEGSIASISGQRLRFHESAGQVHFHDDAAKLKTAIPVAEWWKAWEKLRSQATIWEWLDSVNETVFSVETRISSDYNGGSFVQSFVTLRKALYDNNFKALNLFVKKR